MRAVGFSCARIPAELLTKIEKEIRQRMNFLNHYPTSSNLHPSSLTLHPSPILVDISLLISDSPLRGISGSIKGEKGLEKA